MVKLSDTRWLSHECCLRATRKELPALITTLHHLNITTGYAEAYSLALVLAPFCGFDSIILLSKVLDLLAKLNSFMQRQAADFSRLPLILDSIEKELKLFKKNGAGWWLEVTSIVKKLEDNHIIVRRGEPHTWRSQSFQCVSQFHISVAVLHFDNSFANMKSHFTDVAVKLLVSFFIFNPALLPSEEEDFSLIENKILKPRLSFIEVKQHCPIIMRPTLPLLLLTRMTL